MSIRAIRGATKLKEDSAEEMNEAVSELLTTMLDRNNLSSNDLICVFFTATQDVVSGFPAAAARELGWKDIPLICGVEMNVTNSLPLAIRVMMHIESSTPRNQISHVYLRGAEVLRLDIAQ
jgi:chorismate mutase